MLAMVVVSIGMVSSCKDYDEDRYNDLSWKLQDQNASLLDLIKAQKTALENQKKNLTDQIKHLQDSINSNIKSCDCTVDKMKNCIASYVIDNNITDQNKVAQMISDSIKAHPGLSKEEIQQMIDQVQPLILASSELKQLINTIARDVNRADSLQTATQEQTIKEQGEDIDDLSKHVADHCDSIKANTDSIKSLIQISSDLNKAIVNAAAKANAAYELAKQDSIELEGLKAIVDTLKDDIATWGPQITSAATTAAEALAKANTIDSLHNATLVALGQVQEDLVDSDSALSKRIKDLAEKMEEEMKTLATKEHACNLSDSLKSLYDSMDEYVKASVLNDYVTKDDLKDDLSKYVKTTKFNLTVSQLTAAYEKADKELSDRIDALEDRVDDLEDAIEKMLDIFKTQVTSLLIQEVYNPVFGAYSYPTGFNTKVLAAFYGVNDNEVEFPTDATLNYVYKENALTAKDMEMIGDIEKFTADAQSTLMNEEEGNAGTVYVTVNPNTTDFTGKVLEVVNSQDANALVSLSALTPSDYTISFGHQRSANNGFYEAKATFSPDDVEALKLQTTISKSQMKDIAKSVYNSLKSGDKNGSVASFTSAVLAFNSAIEGYFHNLDANALKATWTDTLGEHSVVSQYEMAVTAIQPLSFSFLKDVELGKLPQFNKFADKLYGVIDDITFDFDPIVFNIDGANASISFEKITFNEVGDLVGVFAVPTFNTDGTWDGNYDTWYYPIDLDDMKTDMAKAINQKLGKYADDAADEINKQVDKLIDQINDQIASVNSQIQGQLDSNIAKVKNDLKNNAAKMFDKMNGFVNQINKRLDNLNAYLQPAAVYEAKDGCLYSLSTSKAFPTEFVGTGAIDILLTSCTGELIVPAFKKHFAVTNVFKGSKSAQGGDTDCKSVLDAANAGEDMNTVLDREEFNGNAVVFTADQAGYVYEIAYSVLDYSGKISTRKYYVTVK